jgi:hypothetical protein
VSALVFPWFEADLPPWERAMFRIMKFFRGPLYEFFAGAIFITFFFAVIYLISEYILMPAYELKSQT